LCSSKGFSTKYSPSQTPALVTYLNGLTSSVIVLIATYDEPQAAFNSPIPADMINAINDAVVQTISGLRMILLLESFSVIKDYIPV
jgi:hypothetical protein